MLIIEVFFLEFKMTSTKNMITIFDEVTTTLLE